MKAFPPIFLTVATLAAQDANTLRLALDQGQYLHAMAEADRRLGKDPKDALAWAIRSQALAALVRMDEAFQAAEWSLHLQPGLADGFLARGMARAGMAIRQRNLGSVGLVRTAMRDLRAAVEADPTLKTGWISLGMAYQHLPGILGGSTRKALQCADALRGVDGPKGDLLAGTILAYDGKWATAQPFLRKAISAGAGDDQVVFGYLEVLASREVRAAVGEKQQHDLLESEAKRLLPLVAGRGRALQAVSDAFLDAGQPATAWRTAEEGLKQASSPSLLRAQLGKISARSGLNLQQGLSQLDLALQQPLEGGLGGIQTLHWRRGQIYRALGDSGSARKAAEAALAIDPAHRGANRLLEELASK